MKTIKSKKWLLIFLFGTFLLHSCDQIVEEVLGEAVDCIFPHKPELKGQLNDGKLGEPYSGSITASIKNTPNEDDFDFEFQFMGSLPDGVQYTFFDQNVRISGTPQEAGTFRFSVTVSIFDTREDSNDGTCFGDNTTSEEYVIVIQP